MSCPDCQNANDGVCYPHEVHRLKCRVISLEAQVEDLQKALADVCDDDLDHEACVDHAAMVLAQYRKRRASLSPGGLPGGKVEP